MITKSEVKENLLILTGTFSIIPWETCLVLSAISTIILAFFGSARLNSSKIDLDIILMMAPKSTIEFMLNISTEQGIVRLPEFDFSVDRSELPIFLGHHLGLASYGLNDYRPFFVEFSSISLIPLQTSHLGLDRSVLVEFFEGWKPLSPLQLAVEEVMSE
ncbi:hypothetical protein Tco_0127158 [Tanacetum coccineum]